MCCNQLFIEWEGEGTKILPLAPHTTNLSSLATTFLSNTRDGSRKLKNGILLENYESTPIYFKSHPFNSHKNRIEEFHGSDNDIITGSQPSWRHTCSELRGSTDKEV